MLLLFLFSSLFMSVVRFRVRIRKQKGYRITFYQLYNFTHMFSAKTQNTNTEDRKGEGESFSLRIPIDGSEGHSFGANNFITHFIS